MSESQNNKKSRNNSRNKRIGLMVTGLVLLFGVLAVLGYVFRDSIQKTLQPSASTYTKKGTDGSPTKMEDNYNQAIAAWKKNDKEAAKDYAQKVLDENDRMTNENQLTLSNQNEMVEDAINIANGEAPHDRY